MYQTDVVDTETLFRIVQSIPSPKAEVFKKWLAKIGYDLRDHMSPLELALTMLGETTTAELARNADAQGFKDNERAAGTGGKIAGEARKNIEKQLGKPVVTRKNFLNISDEQQGKLPSK